VSDFEAHLTMKAMAAAEAATDSTKPQ